MHPLRSCTVWALPACFSSLIWGHLPSSSLTPSSQADLLTATHMSMMALPPQQDLYPGYHLYTSGPYIDGSLPSFGLNETGLPRPHHLKQTPTQPAPSVATPPLTYCSEGCYSGAKVDTVAPSRDRCCCWWNQRL